MFQELDLVRLPAGIPEAGVTPGELATVLLVHAEGEAYEIEVCDNEGRSIFLGAVRQSKTPMSILKRLPNDAVVKVMTDYHCHPLWITTAAGTEPVDPVSLPISMDLANSLEQWAADYDATVNMDDPASTQFPSDEHERRFITTGAALAADLAAQMPQFCVQYFTPGRGVQDVSPPQL